MLLDSLDYPFTIVHVIYSIIMCFIVILEIATVIQRLSDVPQDRMFIKAELSNE